MLTKSKIAVVAAIAMLGLSSTAFAQAFSSSYGTGNVQSSYFDSNGALHQGTAPQQNQIAVHRNGLNAFASVPRTAAGEDSPAATGGGSIGYNEMLQNDQW